MRAYQRLDGEQPGIIAYGSTVEELFEHAGFGLFDTVHGVDGVAPTYSRPIVAPGDTFEELLVNWLDELLFVARGEGLVWSSFSVDRLEEGGVQGSAAGLPVAEAPPPSLAVSGVDAVPSGLVPVPDGWWAEIRFVTGPGLRVV